MYRLTIEVYRKIDYILYSYLLGDSYFPKNPINNSLKIISFEQYNYSLLLQYIVYCPVNNL